ncbi:response regulator [Leptolyngbya ohadii]|uniref:response regulator n=1 Tax=Leptolyngbya ohadii TaxID=1962290 RepID=UPI000B5A14C6|nr:response regulator [Leptolyngbya ohadii]
MQSHPAQSKAFTKQASLAEPLRGVRVLLVEDELDVATLLLFILTEAGAEVAWVAQSADALICLQDVHPHILISNVKLPDYDGDWLIQAIRATELDNHHHLPAIAITSHTRDIAEQRMLDAGFERFLPKTFEPDQLIAAILELL